MAKIDFYALEPFEKAAIFKAVAEEKSMKAFAVEKDWWVSRTLELIFQMEIAQHLVFKGGTSLSKAWKLIHRFSEDIDLAIDRTFFFNSEKGWTRKEITKLRKESGIYSTETFFDDLKEAFKKKGYQGLDFQVLEAKDSDQDPRILEIYYPNIIQADSAYILPKIQIEISCRSLREPFTLKAFGSLVDETFPEKEFTKPMFQVPTVNPERTFLEKLFLLHEEFHRHSDNIRVNRLSRHLYDVFHLTQSGVAEKAIRDKELYETIVAHRFKFSKVGGVDYNLHHPKTLNPIPIPQKIKEWEVDYAKMRDDMIYESNKPTFQQLINNLQELRKKLQSVDWKFEQHFSRKE